MTPFIGYGVMTPKKTATTAQRLVQKMFSFDSLRYADITADETRGTAIGRAYAALPDYDSRPIVHKCYDAFIRETMAQLANIEKVLTVEVTDSDPYADFSELFADIRDNGRLAVLSSATTGGHPYMTNDQNDAFRAVHDFHGHFMSGRDFTRHGEEAAFQRHMRMYGIFARRAMTVETRGQNSMFIWINGGGNNFPTQKFALLPKWCTYSGLI